MELYAKGGLFFPPNNQQVLTRLVAKVKVTNNQKVTTKRSDLNKHVP